MTPADRQLQLDQDLRNALATPTGRRLLWNLIDERAAAHGLTFSQEQTHTAAFLEGKRAVGLELLLDCQRVAPSDYVHMLSEALERREQDARNDEESSDGR